MVNVKQLHDKKPSVSMDQVEAYLKKHPKLKNELEGSISKKAQEDTQFFLELIHGHHHSAKDLKDIESLNIPTSEDIAKLVKENVEPVHQTMALYSRELDGRSKDSYSKLHTRIEEINKQFSGMEKFYKTLKLTPDFTKEISDISTQLKAYSNLLENKPSITGFEEFEKKILASLTEKVSGTTKIVHINQGGGGLGAIPLNRIPGVNINEPQDGDVLTYQSTTQTWVNGVASSGGEKFVIQTTPLSVGHANTGTVYNNIGAEEPVIATIRSTSQPGDTWEFQVGQDINGFQIVADGRSIRFGASESIVGGSITSIQEGAIVRVQVIDENKVFVRYSQRTWSIV